MNKPSIQLFITLINNKKGLVSLGKNETSPFFIHIGLKKHAAVDRSEPLTMYS